MAKNSPQDLKNREFFSENLNRIMKEKNIRQVDLHNALGIPKSTLTGYVKGRSMPTAGNLQKLADFLHVKKSDLDPRFLHNNLDEIARHELSEFYKKLIEDGIDDILTRFIMTELNDIYFNPNKQYPSNSFRDKEQFLIHFSQNSVAVKEKWLNVKEVNYYVLDRLKRNISQAFKETQVILNNNINNNNEYIIHGLDPQKIPDLSKKLTELEGEILERIQNLELSHSDA
ncbi:MULTISPECIES: helix-turn-helix transcriptional regulator [Streptococcus]|jgi:DNA-binding phage protein|uniref:DNA-binding helix-turn-helix protein n=1 Tax=Streptococcus mitis SK1073 TaxID=1008452 RepID=F9HBQ5_STRMT|nr:MULTISPECIES: helix-turn-helix transcriptional regulator [Streptococcus]EGP68981.1 DNA-binding helix-turn-helix protein [Streptococcus mitis SK1073]MCP9059433.1 helix-turn-helix domain-containing protein [Streptococcus sp. CF7_Ac1-12]MCP9084112.1 helix-turn-helix domain-containing protein [Streptococcus sp. CF7_Ac1-8]